MEQSQTINAEQEAQQKEYKRIKDAMKADIKELCKKQLHQKTELRQPHVPSTSSLQVNAYLDRVDLRHMFIAYAVFRHILNGACKKNIPEVNYEYVSGKIVRKDGKAITNQENAPKMRLITQILEKYGAEIKLTKTVHIS